MSPNEAAIALSGILTLGYVLLCAAVPYGNCRKCRGFGRQLRHSRVTGRLKPGRTCRRCRGHGRRIRAGRWLYNHAAALYRATNPPKQTQR